MSEPKPASDSPNRMRSIWAWLRLLMGIIGLGLLISVFDAKEISAVMRQAKPIYLPLALGLMLAANIFKTWRWGILLHQNGVYIPYRRLFGTYLIGAFYSQFLPGASAGGDAMRMAESTVDTGRGVDSVAAVIIERAIGLITIVTTAALILLIGQHSGIPNGVKLFTYSLSIIGITGLIVLRFGWFITPMTAILSRFKLRGIAKKIAALSHALQTDLGNQRNILMMVALSLLANACSMTGFYLVLLALTDPVPYFSFLSLVALISAIEIVPLTPGALGIREATYVFFLRYLGIPEATALSIGLLIRLVTWTLAVTGGLILLQRGLKQWRKPAAPATES